MKNTKNLSEDPQYSQDRKLTNLVSHGCKSELPNNVAETPVPDSVSVSVSSNDNKKVSREDIELVQNLIERCLQLYMNKDVVVKTLLYRARIDPRFTNLVWQKLEEENPNFFRTYYIRLILKKQIISFNNLLAHQYHMMKYPVSPKVPLAPMQNRIHPIPATRQPHIDPMGYSTTSSHIVNEFPLQDIIFLCPCILETIQRWTHLGLIYHPLCPLCHQATVFHPCRICLSAQLQ